MEMLITLEGRATVRAHYNDQVITTDQPQPTGDNSAPAPFDLFLASIGTCAGFYVKSFCAQRGIPADRIRIIQKFDFNPEKHLITGINLDIQLPPDFPGKYASAVVRAAELCTVKRHLHEPPVVTVSTSGRI